MARKNDVKNINLHVDEFAPFVNESCVGFIIAWSSDIGFGEYTVYKSKEDDKWYADSECMDSNENKEFISELINLFVEQLEVKS